jgi:hypothetical protein
MREALFVTAAFAVIFFLWNIFSEREKPQTALKNAAVVGGGFAAIYLAWAILFGTFFLLVHLFGLPVAIALTGVLGWLLLGRRKKSN